MSDPVTQILTNIVDPTLGAVIATALGGLAARSLVLFNRGAKNNQVKDEILTLVRAASKQIPDTTAGRKALVQDGIRALGLHLDPGVADSYIEAAVTEFEQELGEATNKPSIPAAPAPAPVAAPSEPAAQQLFVQDAAGNFVPVNH